MSEKSDKLRAMLAKEKERRIKLNNRIEILERRIQEEDSAEVNEMVRTAKVTPEQLAALLRQSATTTPNPAALSAVGATFEKEDLVHIIPCGLSAAAVCRDTPPDLILHNEHTEFLHLLAQFLDVVADDAVIDVHVSAMVEQVQTTLDVDLQCGGNMVGFFLVLLE